MSCWLPHAHRTTGSYQTINISHRHQQARSTRSQRLGHAQLVQVTRVVVVNRKPGQLPQVADVASVFGASLARGFCFLQGLRRKDGQQAAGAHGFYGDLVEMGWVHGVH